MYRWSISFISALLGVGLLAGSCSRTHPSEAASSDGPPLIYWFVIDALRADVVGQRHNEEVVMPTLTNFMKDSVYFEEAYVQSPFTKISTSSWFTGMWPTRLDVHGVQVESFGRKTNIGFNLRFSHTTVAEHLASRGYETFTKVYTIHTLEGDGLLQGFEHQDRTPRKFTSGRPAFVYEHILGAHGPYTPSDEALRYLNVESTSGIDPGSQEWFFRPFSSMDEVADLRKFYLAEAYDSDRAFLQLLEDLRASGLYDDSLIIVTADHGEEFLEHGLTQHSNSLHKETLHVPLFLKFPKGSPWARHHGRTVSERVPLVDIFPTIGQLVGAPVGWKIDGQSLLPGLNANSPAGSARQILSYMSYLILRNGVPDYFQAVGIYSGRYKAISGTQHYDSQFPATFPFRAGDPVHALYDLEADPFEKENLYEAKPMLHSKLMTEVERISARAMKDSPQDASPKSAAGARQLTEEEMDQRMEELKTLGYVQ